jgi:hypothetical protein
MSLHLFHLLKITEQSLTPDFQEGDFVITLKVPLFFDHYKEGDVIVFDQVSYGRMIKRVQAVSPEDNSLFVLGSHPNSIDSREFGAVQTKTVLGKVIWHISKKTSA